MIDALIDCPSSRGHKQWTQPKYLAGSIVWNEKCNHKTQFAQYTYSKPNTDTFYPFNIITEEIYGD